MDTSSAVLHVLLYLTPLILLPAIVVAAVVWLKLGRRNESPGNRE